MDVSLHLSGYGPVEFQFDEIAHPAFVRLPNGSYLRFEDAVLDPRLLTMLQRRLHKRLDELLNREGIGAARRRLAREAAALSWYLTRLERRLQQRAAVREAERLLGFEPEAEPGRPDLMAEAEVRAELEAAGEEPLRTEDGYGVRRLPIEVVNDALQA